MHAVGIEEIPQARTFWLEEWRSTPASVYGRTGLTSHRASTTELAPPQAIPRLVAPTADDEAGPAPVALNIVSDDALTSWKLGLCGGSACRCGSGLVQRGALQRSLVRECPTYCSPLHPRSSLFTPISPLLSPPSSPISTRVLPQISVSFFAGSAFSAFFFPSMNMKTPRMDSLDSYSGREMMEMVAVKAQATLMKTQKAQ